MINLNENFRYVLQEEAAIEDFEDCSLVLLCNQLQLIQINKTARYILDLMDGERNLKEIIGYMAREFGINEKEAKKDIQKLVSNLGVQGVLKPVVKLSIQGRQNMSNKTSFLANPDVSLREENDDGAILFNPDTDALLIINPVGQLIWEFSKAHPRTRSDIVQHIKDTCEAVPAEQVETDVDEFINDLNTKGFIGEVVDE